MKQNWTANLRSAIFYVDVNCIIMKKFLCEAYKCTHKPTPPGNGKYFCVSSNASTLLDEFVLNGLDVTSPKFIYKVHYSYFYSVQGDSGGPLVSKDILPTVLNAPPKVFLVGLLVMGMRDPAPPPGPEPDPDLTFIDIPSQKNWIDSIILNQRTSSVKPLQTTSLETIFVLLLFSFDD